MNDVRPLVVPQVNVNDEFVLFVRWRVPPFASVARGDVVCEVETSKANAEVTAEHAGVLLQRAEPGSRIRIGDVIGAIGPTRDAVVAYAETAGAAAAAAAAGRAEIRVTPRAKALAEEHQVPLEALAENVTGTIKESDVRAFMARRGDRVASHAAPAHDLAPAVLKYVELEGPLTPFDAAIAASLRQSISRLILTSIDMDCRLERARETIQQALGAGRMVTTLHLVIAAAARALARHPRLMSLVHDGAVYRYRAVDVAFVVRDSQGRLFTPVVRGADRLEPDAVARACQAATLQVMRNAVRAEDLEGACFTISHVPVAGTARVVALPNAGQSAILGVSAERTRVELRDGAAVEVPFVTLTLSYDHALCDGTYAATFLADVVSSLEGARS